MEISVKNILSYYCEQEIKNFIDNDDVNIDEISFDVTLVYENKKVTYNVYLPNFEVNVDRVLGNEITVVLNQGISVMTDNITLDTGVDEIKNVRSIHTSAKNCSANVECAITLTVTDLSGWVYTVSKLLNVSITSKSKQHRPLPQQQKSYPHGATNPNRGRNHPSSAL